MIATTPDSERRYSPELADKLKSPRLLETVDQVLASPNSHTIEIN